GKVM
ncbi:phage tail fiber repeat protein, partial [Haemophilus influenzae]